MKTLIDNSQQSTVNTPIDDLDAFLAGYKPASAQMTVSEGAKPRPLILHYRNHWKILSSIIRPVRKPGNLNLLKPLEPVAQAEHRL